jgi:NADH-ubiquinone oxidoreductase chain 5
MAAPTPVRALVHSSTLVTAGIWLLIQFNQLIVISRVLLFSIGLVTLILARTFALIEVDGKKIVALSTLSQLGLIVFAIAVGGIQTCLFHLFIHALAKANLFIIVGGLIRTRFSNQDIREIGKALNSSVNYNLFIFIRILRLRGRLFISGFFSKDMILINHLTIFNRAVT